MPSKIDKQPLIGSGLSDNSDLLFQRMQKFRMLQPKIWKAQINCKDQPNIKTGIDSQCSFFPHLVVG